MKLTLDECIAKVGKCRELKIVCCICKKVLKAGPDDNVSDGECEPCCTKKMWMAGMPEEDLTEFNDFMEGK